jgi:hypothetical protein
LGLLSNEGQVTRQLDNDHQSPTIDMLVLLCRTLKVRPSAILAEVERRPEQEERAKKAEGEEGEEIGSHSS